MFDIIDTKTFMDPVHGYINVPKCFVEHLIDTEAFQRLRNIDQTGMRTLYPDAKHDRFGHSLGVYYLGSKAVDTLLENFSHDDYWNISSDNKKVLFWAKNKVLFLISCLLHDIGHAPFSHALEQLMLDNSASEDRNFTAMLAAELNKREAEFDEDISSVDIKASPHEKIGAMFILEHLAGNIEKLFEDLIAQQYPTAQTDDILYSEHYYYNPVIDTADLQRDICFIARMILGLKYKGYEPEKQIRNCFVELLNGNNFDVDKLDYVIRDTKMSGISNISIDIERLLGAVCIITKTKYTVQEYHQQDFSNSTIYSLKNSKDKEIQISGHFLGTILLYPDAEVIIEKGSKLLSLTTSSGLSSIRYTEEAEPARFSSSTEITQNGIRCMRLIALNPNLKAIELPALEGNSFECNISNAEVISEGGFHFTVCGNVTPVKLQVNSHCIVRIKGRCATDASVSFFENTKLNGCVQEIILMGNTINGRVPNNKAYNEFSVGFKKQAINIIANVLEARDYLYLWIYAHHKVIYYANFLIPILSAEILGNNEQKDFPNWKLNYTNLEKLDDAYVWTAIKYRRYLSGDTEIDNLCKELLDRTYKISLYKSLAEYELLFESFTNKLSIKNYFSEHLRKDRPSLLDAGNITAGYIDDEFLGKLKDYENIDNISSIVFVDASYKSKKTDAHSTFIVINEAVASIDKIPLLADRITVSGVNTAHYFYLYYETSTKNIKERKSEAIRLKNAIKAFFKEEENK